MRRENVFVIVALMLIALTLTACGSGEESPREEVAEVPTEAVTHTETEEHTDEETAADGLALFRSIGCAGCHGEDGEGGVGPALPGHTAEQVRRQVRTPVGDVMPAYSQEQLSEAQLDLIIAWVESLGSASGEHAHDHGEEVASHHFDDAAARLRLAFFAITDGNAHDAEHHLEDLVAVLDDEHAKSQAEEIIASIQAGTDLHEVEHEMEHLLGDVSPETAEFQGPSLHLQLVLDSLTLNDLEGAADHLDHYAKLVDDSDLVAQVEELKAHLEEGDLHAVEEGVLALLTGQEPDHQH